MSFGFIKTLVSSPSLLIFAAAQLIYPAIDLKVQAGIWHLWNGDTIRFQQYDIPVPTGWIASQAAARSVGIGEVVTHLPRGAMHPTIVFMNKIAVDKDLALRMHEEYLKSINEQEVDRRTVNFDGERADCISSGRLAGQNSMPNDSMVETKCESTDGLTVISIGDRQNIDTVISVLSQIRKHND